MTALTKTPVYEIPAYDPNAAMKILNLKEVFAGVDQVFSYALAEAFRDRQAVYGIPNPHAQGVYSRLRRAWLSGFRDLDDFKADIFPPEGFHLIEGPVERKLREGLTSLFLARMALPYGQPTYGVQGPVFANEDVHYGAFSFEKSFMMNRSEKPDNEWVYKTFHIVEKTPDRLNICYVRTSHNNLPVNIHYCADDLLREINKRYDNAARGVPIQIFLYSPKEGANGGPEGFSLIKRMQDGVSIPEVLPLDRLPPIISRLYYRHRDRIQPGLTGDLVDSPYMDFRGFALRTMVPPSPQSSSAPTSPAV